MLRSIIISEDSELSSELESVLESTGEATVGRTLHQYPSETSLARLARAWKPDCAFIDFGSPEKAREAAEVLTSEVHGIQIVAMHRQCDATILRETMRVGIREFLHPPFDESSVREALDRVRMMLEQNRPALENSSEILSFLPSKAGVGASTLALNVSSALSRVGERVLLSDFDLSSGMMRFMLKLEKRFSVVDAVEHAEEMDDSLWPDLVTTVDSLDVLHAGRVNPNFRISGPQVQSLIDYMRRNYEVLCFDLSGNLERYSLAVMQESKRIFMVCTAEVASLHQAREKLQFLRDLDLESRVSILLNRCEKRALLSSKEVEEILGKPVLKMFPNDYQGVSRALNAGSAIDAKSEVGKAVETFARELLNRPAPEPEEKPKFLKFFSTQGRQVLHGQK